MSMRLPHTTTSAGWQPESPFLPDPLARENEAPVSPARAFGPLGVESPFTSEYVREGELVPGPQAEMFASLMGELYEQEFEEALTDLANEATALVEDRFSYEGSDQPQQRAEAERAVRDYLAPLEREAHALIDRMTAGLDPVDVASITEAEFEAFFDRFEPSSSSPSPAFENFLKKLWKKAKKVVKTVAKAATKVLPIKAVLGKLKALVRPLLERVLRFAIDKLPAPARPLAKQLAKQFLGISAGADADPDADADADTDTAPESGSEGRERATSDVAELQEEFDTLLAGYIVEGEAFEREASAADFAATQGMLRADPAAELERARSDFARAVIALNPGEDPQPAVERFASAVLTAARVAISIIGRKRVVEFLAGLLAKLISKYVGQDAALALSRSLVDTGLRLVSLETSPDTERLAAGYTVASTVEDTINRLIADAPQEAWDSEALLEAYAREAFESSAAANFPDADIRPDLRQAAEKSGAWVLMPMKGSRKRYKKYTRVVDVRVTPQMSTSIASFGGVRLASTLRDQLGMTGTAPIAARAHLYEAIRGTTLSRITWHEKGVPGLGHAGREAWSLLHPLTPEAAGILFQEPGLGIEVASRYLADRNLIGIGQRFYYLEIPGARVQVRPRIPRGPVLPSGGAPSSVPLAGTPPTAPQSSSGSDPARNSQTTLTLDFPRGQMRLCLYYSEADAQKIARALKSGAPATAALGMLTSGRDMQLRAILSGPSRQLQVVHEAVPTDQFVAPAFMRILKLVGPTLARLLLRWLLSAMKSWLEKQYGQFVVEFGRAAESDADGVTLCFVFQAPSFFDPMRKALTDGMKSMPALLASLKGSFAIPSFDAQVRPGYQR